MYRRASVYNFDESIVKGSVNPPKKGFNVFLLKLLYESTIEKRNKYTYYAINEVKILYIG